jgi:hypothetical protein
VRPALGAIELLVRAIPGASVPVRVDPKRPSKLSLELD